MESDKHYFFEGLFVIGFVIAVSFAFVWLARTGHRDDVLYQIRFTESVSGLSLGDPVKYRGVDVGTVSSMIIDPEDPRLVKVDVTLRKDAPVKTDTKASLHLKGITGTVFIELNGGSAAAQRLVAATPAGTIPEIPTEKSKLATILDTLPAVIEKFSSLESKTTKVIGDVGAVAGTIKEAAGNVKETTAKIKEDPSLLLRRPKKPAANPAQQ